MTGGSPDTSFDGTTLALAARRSCAPQWRSFVAALAGTLSEVAGDDVALRVLNGMGRAIAREWPVPACASLSELKSAMNAVLAGLDWGQLEIREADRALELVVVGYPCFEGVEAQTSFAAILEALLDGWLAAQSARPGLAVRLVDRGAGAWPALVFRYERVGPTLP